MRVSNYKDFAENKIGAGIGALILIGALVLIAVTANRFRTLTDDVHPLWHTYERSENAVLGYLYKLENKDARVSIYVSVDKELLQKDYSLADGWSINQVSSEETWNPRVCARMPTIVGSDGSIVMVDVRRNATRKYTSDLVLFSPSSKQVLAADITKLGFKGFLYSDENNEPFFFAQKDQSLYTFTIHNFKTLEKRRVEKLSSDKTATIARDQNWEPIVEIYDGSEFKQSNYRFNENKLIPTNLDGIPLGIYRYSDDNHSEYNLGNEIKATYTLDDPYISRVDFKGSQILAFKREAQVYSYFVGGYLSDTH